jgi:uncharacterized membrane protein YbhN (UPF0104 family)
MIHDPEPEEVRRARVDDSSAGKGTRGHSSDRPRAANEWERWRIWLRILVPLGVLALVWRELSAVDWHQAAIEIQRARPAPILWAALATIVCVSIMGLYDVISFSSGSTYSAFERWRLGTLICSWTNFLAVGPLAGPALRLHFYRRAGMDVGRILRGLAGVYAGMFAGIVAWIAAVFVPLPASNGPASIWPASFGPATSSSGIAGPESAPVTFVRVSIAMLLGPLVCVAVGALISRVRRTLAAENMKTYVALGLVGAVEWGLVVGVFATVGRAIGIDTAFVPMARAFFVGHVAGTASLLPGGLGSADSVWLKMNVAQGTASATAAAQVLLFRCVYFLGPWGLSILAVGADFVRRRRRSAEH